MTEYKDFELTESQIERVKHFAAHKGIVKYIRENGVEPEDSESFFTASDEDLDRMKRCAYTKQVCDECTEN